MSVLRVSSENFFQGALNQRQLDEHEHRFKRLRSQCFPAAVVNASSRREKERPSLDPMSNPGPVAFPLLKLGLTRHGPCDEWFADCGKMHQIDDARRRDDARFDVSPRCPSTGSQTFAANIAFVGFGGSCFGNRHEEKMIDAAEKCEPLQAAASPSRCSTIGHLLKLFGVSISVHRDL